MRRARLFQLLLGALVCAGCGTGAGAGGGAAHLPVSGAGPYRPLADDPTLAFQAPFALSDASADLDDPVVLARGDALSAWVTVRRAGVTDIERADAPSLEEGFGALTPALGATEPWEAGAVAGPAVIAATPWLLFYGAGGAIGAATSGDGVSWSKLPGPLLVADGAEEGATLGPPAAVQIGDRVRLYYLAKGALWAAEAPLASLLASRAGGHSVFARLDGNPATPARDPMVASVPYARSLGRASARVTRTAADRLRYDLYFTALLAPAAGADSSPTVCGFAAAYAGDPFTVGATPLLPAGTDSRDPAATPYRDGFVLLYVQRFGTRDAVAAATSP